MLPSIENNIKNAQNSKSQRPSRAYTSNNNRLNLKLNMEFQMDFV